MASSIGHRLLVDTLFAVFGVGSWLSVCGLYVELPVLVNVLPEGWNLPSYLTMVIQIGNVGIIIYGVLQNYFPEKVHQLTTSYFILSLGLVASLLLIFFWDYTAVIGGVNRSIGLLVLVFLLALVDCTSTVTFIPFVGLFKALYLMPYLVGEGISGLLPSIVALGQGGGNAECRNITFVNTTVEGNFTQWHLETVFSEPKFSVAAFFTTLFAMMIASLIALILLNLLPMAQGERVSDKDEFGGHFTESSMTLHDMGSKNSIEVTSPKLQPGKMKPFTYWYLQMAQAFMSLLVFGVLFAIQPYSCLPYGNTAYHLSATLSNLAYPLACFIAIFTVPLSVTVVTIHCVLCTLTGAYILVLSAMSPNPPLADSDWGTALVIIAWIGCVGFAAYARVGIANILRSQGTRALFWLGVFTQAGSLLGAVIAFVLVVVCSAFKSYNPCE